MKLMELTARQLESVTETMRLLEAAERQGVVVATRVAVESCGQLLARSVVKNQTQTASTCEFDEANS